MSRINKRRHDFQDEDTEPLLCRKSLILSIVFIVNILLGIKTEKVDIGNADIGLRRETFNHEPTYPFALRHDKKSKWSRICRIYRIYRICKICKNRPT